MECGNGDELVWELVRRAFGDDAILSAVVLGRPAAAAAVKGSFLFFYFKSCLMSICNLSVMTELFSLDGGGGRSCSGREAVRRRNRLGLLMPSSLESVIITAGSGCRRLGGVCGVLLHFFCSVVRYWKLIMGSPGPICRQPDFILMSQEMLSHVS